MTVDIYEVTNQSSRDGFKEFVTGPGADHRWGYDVHIKDPTGTGIGAEVSIDGQKLEHVVRYQVDVGLNTPTKVTVTFYAESINKEGTST